MDKHCANDTVIDDSVFRSVVESLPTGLLLMDESGKILFANSHCEALFGYPRGLLQGMNVDVLVPQQYGRKLEQLRTKDYGPGHLSHSSAKGTEVLGVCADGTNIPLMIRIEDFDHQQGMESSTMLVASIHEASTGRSVSDFVHLAVEAAPNAMVLVKEGGEITFVNSATEELLGYSRAELVGQSVEVLLPPRYREQHVTHRDGYFGISQFAQTGCGREQFALRKDGSEVKVEIGLNPVETPEGRFTLASIVDVATRTKLQEEIEMARVDEHDRVRAEFLTRMSHEVRTPLNTVLGMTEILLEDALDEREPLSSRHKVLVDAIQVSGQALLTILTDLLNVSLWETGTTPATTLADFLFSHSVTEWVRFAGARIFSDVGNKPLSFSVFVANNVPLTFKSDPVALRQTVINIIMNAIKFTITGGLSLHCVCCAPSIREKLSGSRMFGSEYVISVLELRIKDSGIGMEADALEHIFEPFMQVETSTARRFGGMGLGLTVAKRVIEAIGGNIIATSIPHAGSEFVMRIPIGISRHVPLRTWGDFTTPLFGVPVILLTPSGDSAFLVTLTQQLSEWGMQTDHASLVDIGQKCSSRSDQPFLVVCTLLGASAMDVMTEMAQIAGVCTGTRGIVWVVSNHVQISAVILNSRGGPKEEIMLAPLDPGILAQILLSLLEGTGPSKRFCEAPPVPSKVPTVEYMACDAAQTTSSVRIPDAPFTDREAEKAPVATGPAQPVTSPPVFTTGRRGHALIVDDNPMNLRVAALFLKRRGFSVSTAENGQEALSCLEEEPADFILLDCEMPVMDGYETVRRIRQREMAWDHLPVIALTAHALESDRQKCLSAGMDEYMAKPLNPKDLDLLLARWTVPFNPVLQQRSGRHLSIAGIREQLSSIVQAANRHGGNRDETISSIRSEATMLRDAAREIGALRLANRCTTLLRAIGEGDPQAVREAAEDVQAESLALVGTTVAGMDSAEATWRDVAKLPEVISTVVSADGPGHQ